MLIAAVGGPGLMGTMSINVRERTREIGVLRPIGASNGAVPHIFVVEGMLIGVLSWIAAASVAAPATFMPARKATRLSMREVLAYE